MNYLQDAAYFVLFNRYTQLEIMQKGALELALLNRESR